MRDGSLRGDSRKEVVWRLRAGGIAAAALAMSIGIAAMAGVVFDVVWLRGTTPLDSLAFTTSLVIAGSGLLLLLYLAAPVSDTTRSRIGRLGGAAIAGIGAAAVTEHVTGTRILPWGLVHDPHAAEIPNLYRPDLESGALMIFGGAYMAMFQASGRSALRARAAIALGMIVVILAGTFGMVLGSGYVWDGIQGGISPQGLVAIMLLAVALLAAHPRQPAFWPVTLSSESARVTRRLLLAGAVVPLLTIRPATPR